MNKRLVVNCKNKNIHQIQILGIWFPIVINPIAIIICGNKTIQGEMYINTEITLRGILKK